MPSVVVDIGAGIEAGIAEGIETGIEAGIEADIEAGMAGKAVAEAEAVGKSMVAEDTLIDCFPVLPARLDSSNKIL